MEVNFALFFCYDIVIDESFRESNKQILDKTNFTVITMIQIISDEQKKCHLESCQQIEGNDSSIRVITKLPNSEQSYKGKVKTHKYINRQNQSTTGKL